MKLSARVLLYALLPFVFFTSVSSSALAQAKFGDLGKNIHGINMSCSARQDAIQMRLSQLMNLVQTIEHTFDSIATRVETYYTTILLPAGKTVPNYNALVAAISSQKTIVATAVAKAQADATSFSCTTGNPKTLFTQFRLDMQAVKSDLKVYRTTIKNLIVAVHHANPLPKPSHSPKPSASPEAK